MNAKTKIEQIEWRNFSNGEIVCEYTGDCDLDDWRLHPQGVLVRAHGKYIEGKGYDYGQILLNGHTLIHQEDGDRWTWHPQGVVVAHGNELSLNGQLLYKGDWNEWYPHPQGVVIEKGKRGSWTHKLLLLNDQVIYEARSYFGWRQHPQGVMIHEGDKLILNGRDLVYQGRLKDWDKDWYIHPQGVVVKIGDQLLLNGEKLLYEGEWQYVFTHPQGIIIQKSDELLLNGQTSLYRGHCRGLKCGYKYRAQLVYDDECVYFLGADTTQGVIIQKGHDKLLLNGQTLLYEGKWNCWRAHPYGVIVEQGNRHNHDGLVPHVQFRFYGNQLA